MATEKAAKKKVRFDRLCIRTYPYMLGENPAVTYGPPLTMDWQPILKESDTTSDSTKDEEIYKVDEYERIRPRRKVTYKRPGYRGPSWIFLVLSQIQREELLQRMGVDKKEVQKAVGEVNRVKRDRWLSLKWYFNPGRTVAELPTNIPLFFRGYGAERKRKRFLRQYNKQSQNKASQ